MSNFARIVGATAIDVSIDPANQFHPIVAAEFVAVPDTVQPGWRLIDGEWEAPEEEPVPAPAPIYPIVSPVRFKQLFTSAERIAINTEKATNPILEDFFSLIDDPRLDSVDLSLPSVQNGLAYLMGLGLITEPRREEILQGVLQ